MAFSRRGKHSKPVLSRLSAGSGCAGGSVFEQHVPSCFCPYDSGHFGLTLGNVYSDQQQAWWLGEVGDIIVSQQMPIWEYEFQGVPLLMLYAYPKRGAYDAGARYVFEHIEALDVLWHDDEEELQIIWRLRESAPSLGLFIDQVDSGRRVLERTHQERLYSLYPTEFWLPGDTIRTRYPILLQPRTETFEIRIIERESEREEGLIRMKVSH